MELPAHNIPVQRMPSRRPQHNKQQSLAALREARKNRPDGERPPRLLVLVGIPGSGKSTFASLLEDTGFAVICQDVLGDRKECERKTVEHLLHERHVVIDRCNFDPAQRKHWVDYGNACGAEMGVIVFGVPMEVCLQRVQNRHGHPTLRPGGESDHVVVRMARSFVFPTREEGFGFCRVIREEEDFYRVYDELRKWIGRVD